MTNDFQEFCNTFDLVENSLDMRTLMRWNGRNLREKENLSEHTHLVVSCAIKLYDELTKMKAIYKKVINFEKLVRYCMLHDSLELLRGDVLSITKDTVPGLREYCDAEEDSFIKSKLGKINSVTKEIAILADLMACYKFIEYELKYPSNDFALDVYKSTKKKFDERYNKFLLDRGFIKAENEVLQDFKFTKGYKEDAGVDVILDKDVMFMPMSTCVVDLGVVVSPKNKEMSLLCSRTSAANKGLLISMCPIDPNYKGHVNAIVHNISNSIIHYKKGEAFCQVITVPFNDIPCDDEILIKKDGVRSDGKFGSTGGVTC